MKLVVFSIVFCIFHPFLWAEVPFNKKTDIPHMEHPDHVPHHPKGKDPTDQGGHDGIIYPRKKIKKGLLETV